MTRPAGEAIASQYAAWSAGSGRKGAQPVIHVSRLTKYYGDYPAVQDISFDPFDFIKNIKRNIKGHLTCASTNSADRIIFLNEFFDEI